MGLLDFLRGKPKGLSADALYDPQRFEDFTPTQWEQFVRELSQALDRHKLQAVAKGPGEILIKAKEHLIFLDNVSMDWLHADPSGREAVLDRFLAHTVNVSDENPLSKDEALAALCIRCYTAVENDMFRNCYVREVANNYAFVLALDLANTYKSLNRDYGEKLGLCEADLWGHAYANLLGSKELVVTQLGEAEHCAFLVINEASAPAIALYLIEHDERMRGLLGAFWAPVSTSVSAIIPVHTETAIDTANTYTELLSKQYLEDDRPISIDLFWWRGEGQWLRIPAQQGLNKVYFYELPEVV